ncbi:hypothetical protein X975_08920, partial [Stegodyphus mimosarum]
MSKMCSALVGTRSLDLSNTGRVCYRYTTKACLSMAGLGASRLGPFFVSIEEALATQGLHLLLSHSDAWAGVSS